MVRENRVGYWSTFGGEFIERNLVRGRRGGLFSREGSGVGKGRLESWLRIALIAVSSNYENGKLKKLAIIMRKINAMYFSYIYL